jgi:hypothetical protein
MWEYFRMKMSSVALNDATARRVQIGREIAAAYRRDPRVRAVALTGSVARGDADRYSDVEVATFWQTGPSVEERRALAEEVGGSQWRGYPFNDLGAGEWSEEYEVGGTKVDGIHQTVEAVERLLTDVLESYDPALPKQVAVGAIHHAIPLHGHALIEDWQSRTSAYPDDLAEAVVREYLSFGPTAWVEMLAERGDILALYDVYVHAMKNMLGVLIGLNKLYHPGEKRIARTISEMILTPPDLLRRMTAMLRGQPRDGARELEQLIDETLGLVEQQMPRIDTTQVRARLGERRPIVDAPPTRQG